MNDLTLKQLRYFDAVAAQGHFGRAADICAISQPAISVQIKEMERSLGVILFERSARQVRLTQAGEDLIQRARAGVFGRRAYTITPWHNPNDCAVPAPLLYRCVDQGEPKP